MLYTTDDIERLNQFLSNHRYKDFSLNMAKMEIAYFLDIQVLGGMALCVFRGNACDMVVNTATSIDLSTLDPKDRDMVILHALALHIHQKCHITPLSLGVFPATRLSQVEKESIDTKFNLPGNFTTIEAWAAGDSYLVHGQHGKRDVILMPYIGLGKTVGDAVALGLESGNYQLLGSKETEKSIPILLDGYEFYLPMSIEIELEELQ